MPVFMTFDQGVPMKILIDSKQVFFIPCSRPICSHEITQLFPASVSYSSSSNNDVF